MNSLVQELEALNFTKMEAMVYVTLVRHNELNGSQIAKYINTSRSSVYSALNNLYNKGYVFLLPGESNLYRPEDPTILIDNLKKAFVNTAEKLKSDFKEIFMPTDDLQFFNIKGFDAFINKAKEMLKSAEKEVYINSSVDFLLFKDELSEITRKGVRVIAFTFEDHVPGNLNIEIYKSQCIYENGDDIRMMLVVDNSSTLIASKSKNDEFIGTFSSNPLLVSIISEHIHHDIYLLKLKNKNKNLINEDILLNTMQEKGEPDGRKSEN